MYHFVSKNRTNLTKNSLSTDFIPWAPSTVSVHGEISINFRIQFRVSFLIKQIVMWMQQGCNWHFGEIEFFGGYEMIEYLLCWFISRITTLFVLFMNINLFRFNCKVCFFFKTINIPKFESKINFRKQIDSVVFSVIDIKLAILAVRKKMFCP